MNVDEIRTILDLVREHELTEFELEIDGLKIKVKKTPAGHVVQLPGAAPYPPLPAIALPPSASVPAGTSPAAPRPVPDALSADLAIVKSPIVGTFYRASEPNAPPFVDTGAHVKKGQTLCIIEAMKLMNEIESDYEGDVVSVYVDNGQAVQYGERLFAIKVK
ncbi:MAG: acetyl-CoA carboxylase biotin carboxyl carrier protein [Acidobacteriota bacterium]